MAEYTIGVDLGQSSDPTAIAIVRKVDGVFQVGHLERIPLRTPYPGVVSHVLRLLGQFPTGTEVCIDFTGVGRPVFDMFETKGLSPIGVTITSGDVISRENMIWRVPKIILVSGASATPRWAIEDSERAEGREDSY